MSKKTVKIEEIKEIKNVVIGKSREEQDLEYYEALYDELNSLGIRSIGDLENLIAVARKVIAN